MTNAVLTRLVDTSILVDFLRGNPIAKNWLIQFSAGELAISKRACRTTLLSVSQRIIFGWG